MGHAAGQDKYVPGGVEVAAGVECEKDDSQRVSEPAGSQPGDSLDAKLMQKRPDCENNEPALKQIDKRREDGETAGLKPLHGNALGEHTGEGEHPLDSKHRPAEGSAQGDERERGVGAGDEKVNGRVVEDVKDRPRAGKHQRVIERGTEINEDQRGGEDGATNDDPGRAAGGGGDEIDGTSDGESSADAMGNSVSEDVAETESIQVLLRRHKSMIVPVERTRRGMRACDS